MTDKPKAKNLVPSLIQQNPAPFVADSQDRKDATRAQVDLIMAAFFKLLPSNYSSQVQGPYYTLQFQAMAERIADFQISAQEMLADSMYDYTRTEVLYQILGSLVFPDAASTGFPTIDGDTSYRTFLQSMVKLLLQGATKNSVQSGVELLTTATVEVIERGIEARKLKGQSAWTAGDQFTFEVNVWNSDKFPDEDPVTLQRNVDIVLRALKPAHALYEYRHVFVETFGTLFTAEDSWAIKDYKYQDLRRYWLGTKSISGRGGITLIDRTLFSDPTRDFSNVNLGAMLAITTGPNSVGNGSMVQTPDDRLENYPGRYRVVDVIGFPIPTDAVPRSYICGALSGKATVSNGDVITDLNQDWGVGTSDGQIFVFTEGPNIGSYRLKTVLGSEGGPIGSSSVSGTAVRISHSVLRTKTRMPESLDGQWYEVDVDRLGVQIPHLVTNESPKLDVANNSVWTNRGPLVKDWGDMTPASIGDVTVSVNGNPATIVAVNPHTGEVTFSDPFVFDDVILISYHWLATPVTEMTGLNQPGQVLNKWDRNITGHHGGSPNPQEMGAPDLSRFPYCVVLGPMATPQPLLIGHRYMGFEKAYSALLNSPTTMTLNTNPNQYEVPASEQLPVGTTATYDATVVPSLSTPPWVLVGVDSGSLVGNGTYRVVDHDTGSFAPANPPCAMYKQDVDIGFPASAVVVSRYLVNTTTADGVFTGVGFGFHQSKRLYMVGNLLVNSVQHVGLLKDARNPHLLKSWDVGPKVTGTIVSPTTISFVNDDGYPSSFTNDARFQILSPHTQAGVYTATHAVLQSDGTVTVTVTPPFPATPDKWGNKYPDVYFETLWLNKPTTYRLALSPVANTNTWNVKLSLSGETTVLKVLEGDAFGSDLPQVATSSLALFTDQSAPDKKIGTVVWGSLSYAAKNDTTWSFIRYGVVPNATAYRGHSKSVVTDMSILPENESNPDWYLTQAFGLSSVGHGQLLLKSTSANSLDTSFAYGRNEPFFVNDSNVDLTASFSIDTGVLGACDCEIVMNDGVREARVATLMYYEDGDSRQLVSMPNVSFAGLIPLIDQGWDTAQVGDGVATNHENDVVFDQLVDNPSRYIKYLDFSMLVPPDSGERVLEAHFAVDADFVPNVDGKTGVFISGDVGTAAGGGVAVTVWMDGSTPTVSLVLPTGLVSVEDYAFDWADGEQHVYRVVISGGVVSLFVDDTIQIPTKDVALFAGQGSGHHRCMFGSSAVSGVGQVRWRSASYSCIPHSDVHRTLGVYTGGNKQDLDNWKIPRTDVTTVKNSELVGPIIEDMDWLTTMEVRVLRTTDWGVTVFRPDLPPPPLYDGEFATPNMQPSAGWITVEYSKLPYTPRLTGFIGFGSFNPRSITQQRWNHVNFRLFKPIIDDWKAPQHMVLNQFNVVTSGEPILDDTLEMMVIQPFDHRRVFIGSTHVYASNVYKVVDGQIIYTSESWTFNSDSQLLTLNRNPDGGEVHFSGQAVTVIYYPGGPFTDTYLETQKLLDSMTLLNEGVPSIPKSQHNADAKVVHTDGEYKVLIHESDPEAMYESMKFMTVDNGGHRSLITIAGEGFLSPGFTGWASTEGDIVYDENGAPTGNRVGSPTGGHAIQFSGRSYSEHVKPPTDTLQVFHMIEMQAPGGPPVDVLSFHEETLGQYLFVSGGDFLNPQVDGNGNIIGDTPAGGTLNNGQTLFPSKVIH